MKKNIIYKVLIIGFLLNSFIIADWYTGTPLNTPRWGAAAVVLNGYIYVMGGATNNGVLLNTVERYDPVTDTWDDTVVPPFSEARVNAAAIVFNGEIYLMGGRNIQNEETDHVEVYNPQTGLWIAINEMQRQREGHIAVILNSKICVMGGIREGNYEEDIEWFDDSTGQWENSPSELTNPVAAPFASVWNDTLYMFGGFFNGPLGTGRKAIVEQGWYFTWFPAPTLQTPRGGGASAVVEDSMFMIGGNTLNGPTNLVEIYNFQTGQIETSTAAPTARTGMTAAVLNNSIFVIGGYTQNTNQPLSLVEVYDIVTGLDTSPPSVIPVEFAQIRGYPNPFNGEINLQVKIPRQGTATVTIYDIQGRKIATLFNGILSSGEHTLHWNGKDETLGSVASGLYIAVLKTNQTIANFKMLYVK